MDAEDDNLTISIDQELVDEFVCASGRVAQTCSRASR